MTDVDEPMCFAEFFDDRTCDNTAESDSLVCADHTELTESLSASELEVLFTELTDSAIYLGVCSVRGQVDMTERRYHDLLIDLVEQAKYPATQYSNRIRTLYENLPESTATQRIDTERETFFAEHIPGYEPVY